MASHKEHVDRLEEENLALRKQSIKNAGRAIDAIENPALARCEKCGELVPGDALLKHLSDAHGLDVMNFMRIAKTWRGMAWSGMILTIGVILGILLRGMIV